MSHPARSLIVWMRDLRQPWQVAADRLCRSLSLRSLLALADAMGLTLFDLTERYDTISARHAHAHRRRCSPNGQRGRMESGPIETRAARQYQGTLDRSMPIKAAPFPPHG